MQERNSRCHTHTLHTNPHHSSVQSQLSPIAHHQPKPSVIPDQTPQQHRTHPPVFSQWPDTWHAATMPMLRMAAVMSVLVARRAAAQGDTPSPNSPIAKPECDASKTVSFLYSEGSKVLSVMSGDGTRGGCITLTEIWEYLDGAAPLYAVDSGSGDVSDTATGTWLLTENLSIEDGITLEVHGTSAGGDADELRLLSTSDQYVDFRAYGANLDFVSTKVFSWDTSKNAVDVDEDDGRSYIRAVSELVVDDSETCGARPKENKGEARMDIEDSEMAYLGFYAGESYGLTWKVKGLCDDVRNVDLFDKVNVYGNIYDSDIHHNHFGVYTFGHQQGDWRRNKMHHNTAYGFDPHDDSDLLTIHDNEVYDNGNHGIIASKRCNGVSIQGNEVYNGQNVGIFLHRSSDDAIVKDNYVHDNFDAGMAVMESFNAEVSENIFENNMYGVRLSVGCADNVFKHNVISGSTEYSVYTYEGTDDPWMVDSGRQEGNRFFMNTIIGGGKNTIRLRQADGTKFNRNTFQHATELSFEECTGTIMRRNSGLNGVELNIEDSCFHENSNPEFVPVC